MALVKKTAVQAAPARELVNIGDLAMYVGGASVPEGNYALGFTVQYEQATERYTPKVPRIGFLLTCHPLDGGETKTKFLSMGTKAHEVFAPDPDTGKGVVIVPEPKGPAIISPMSGWGIFLKSMYDCGLPIGIFTNDVTSLDGVHVHLANVPEPEERKGFAKTAISEVDEEIRKGNSMTLNVTEIIGLGEGGTPWEGGGGIPDVAAPKPTKPNGSAGVAKPVVNKGIAKAIAPAPAAISDEDLQEAAQAGVADVLGQEANANGAFAVAIRTGTFKYVNQNYGEDVAQAVSTFLLQDENLDGIAQLLGYTLKGKRVVVVG